MDCALNEAADLLHALIDHGVCEAEGRPEFVCIPQASSVPPQCVGLVKQLLKVTGLGQERDHRQLLRVVELLFQDLEQLERKVLAHLKVLKLDLVKDELVHNFLLLHVRVLDELLLLRINHLSKLGAATSNCRFELLRVGLSSRHELLEPVDVALGLVSGSIDLIKGTLIMEHHVIGSFPNGNELRRYNTLGT